MENSTQMIGANAQVSKNTDAGQHANQNIGGGQKAFTLNRVFVAIATKTPAMPAPDGNAYWIIHNEKGEPALEPVKGSLLVVPTNAILSVSIEDCVGLLFYARNVLMKDMTDYSGIQVNVVHTEAVYDTEKRTINTEMSLYPTQYVPLSSINITRAPEAAPSESEDVKLDDTAQSAEANKKEEVSDGQQEDQKTEEGSTTPAE